VGTLVETPGRRVALIVAYRGTAYAGFQRQPGRDTVQARLEAALEDLTGVPIPVRGAGRTDAGVHAAGQVVDCWLPARPRVPVDRLPDALGSRLPRDIRVAAAFPVPEAFDARRQALSKRYRYLVWRARAASPFWDAYAWHYPGPLDVDAMVRAARQLEGRHDFRAFAGAARPVADARRTVFACSVWTDGPWLAVDVEADGFLYRMVRAMVGTLWQVGTGVRPEQEVAALVAGAPRGRAGPSAPPHGLCLVYVRYPEQSGLPPPGAPAWPLPPGPPVPVRLLDPGPGDP
jgi:tRNA pseudouridine38-40 synthase